MKNINVNPYKAILEEELNLSLLKLGSFLSITHNKRLNFINVFLLLLKDKQSKELTQRVCETDSLYNIVKFYLESNPSLCKSKIIKAHFEKNKQ